MSNDVINWKLVAIILGSVLSILIVTFGLFLCLWKLILPKLRINGLWKIDTLDLATPSTETDKLLSRTGSNNSKYQCFAKEGMGQCEQTYEEIKQALNETQPDISSNSVGSNRGSFVATPTDYWPVSSSVKLANHKRAYGSISDSLSIARTESCKSRKASTDSGIAGSIGIGRVIPDLYQRRGTIIRKNSQNSSTSCATIYLKLLYVFKTSDLLVKIEQVTNIPNCIINQLGKQCNPYVTAELIPPVDTITRQTVMRPNQTSPFFCSTFRFPIAYEQLYSHSLHLGLFSIDLSDMSKRKFGKAQLTLDAVDPSMEIDIWLDFLSMEPQKRKVTGKLLLSMNYLPAAERLTLLLMKVKEIDLANFNCNSNNEYYLKIEQSLSGKLIKRRKTAHKPLDNLEWNEEVLLKIKNDQIEESELSISLWEKDKSSCSNQEELLGDLQIGSKITDSNIPLQANRKQHWKDVFNGSNQSTLMWHELHLDL